MENQIHVCSCGKKHTSSARCENCEQPAWPEWSVVDSRGVIKGKVYGASANDARFSARESPEFDIIIPLFIEPSCFKAVVPTPAPERLRMIAACLAALQLSQGTPGFATAPGELRALADAMEGKGDGIDWIKEMVTK